MPYFLYILENSSGRYYVGTTSDISRRFQEHDQGKSKYTKGRGPWTPVHIEQYQSLILARSREAEIKRKKRKSYINWLIK